MNNSFPSWFNTDSVRPVALHGYVSRVAMPFAELKREELGAEEQEVITMLHDIASRAGIANAGHINKTVFELVIEKTGTVRTYVARVFVGYYDGTYKLGLGVDSAGTGYGLVNALGEWLKAKAFEKMESEADNG